jgi:hypothetical protein
MNLCKEEIKNMLVDIIINYSPVSELWKNSLSTTH